MELFVLDDGWFGHRVDDKGGLGDWQINEAKLGCTLPELIHRIHALGMLFGLWVEPGDGSADSDLYAAHPDWHSQCPAVPPPPDAASWYWIWAVPRWWTTCTK